MTRIHFTTTDQYTVVDGNKKKLAKVHLKDPEPPMPTDFSMFKCETGDYVLVSIGYLIAGQTGSKQHIFRQDDRMILTKEWEGYDEDLTVEDLLDLDEDFLLYYQCIDTTSGANCTTKPDKRARPLTASKATKKPPKTNKRRRT